MFLCVALLVFLILISGSPFSKAFPVYEDFSTYGEKEGVHADHTDFWNTFNPNIFWGLSVNGVSHSLDVSEDYSSYEKLCKYTLSFLTSISGNYSVNFSIELEFEEIEVSEDKIKLKYKDEENEFESEFNWLDMFNVSGFDFSFSHVANETGFYFFASDFILGGVNVVIDPVYEDFTDYTEFDMNNHIDIVNSTLVEFDAWRNEDAHLYKYFDVDFFGNFMHNVDVYFHSSDLYAVCPIWGLTPHVNDYKGLSASGDTTIYIYMRRQTSSPKWQITLREYYDVDTPPSESFQDVSITITQATWYFLNIEKDGVDMTVEIYTDSARTVLFDTLSLTLHADHKFPILMACNTQNTGSAVNGMVWIANLNRNAIYITFYFNEGGILRVDNATMINGTQIEYFNQTILEFASLTQNASYVWLNFTWDIGNSTINPYNFTVLSNSTLWCYFDVAGVGGYAGFSFLFFGAIMGVVTGVLIGYASKKS